MKLKKIRKILTDKGKDSTKLSINKFVPTAEKVYGVKVEILNDIVKKIKNPDFDLVKKLWKSGSFEERVLAVKILGKICTKNPELTLKLTEKFSKDLTDWAICDTLGTQGVRKVIKDKQKGFFNLSKRLITSKNVWQRRLAIVLLIELNRHGFSKAKIKKLVKKVENDKEHYIKRGIVWLKNELE